MFPFIHIYDLTYLTWLMSTWGRGGLILATKKQAQHGAAPDRSRHKNYGLIQ